MGKPSLKENQYFSVEILYVLYLRMSVFTKLSNRELVNKSVAMFTTILLSFIVILILIIIKKLKLREVSNADSVTEVPGSLPFFGHLFYLGRRPEEALMKWAKTYGKMFLVNLGPLK